ncbi:OLC1v1021859C1 [Oldenlandia corymbosa var. corymbosa]|uniref:OLC1v1021859C1 n=1 Tax=Oldenlandia corymbosa var. corymbosa TaxID=529605 RepID=A0AAV1BZ87_OLDCO|nr:OLC1v1021859C1 [Oldenlandia corymbosa var. corymbosa]
MAFSRAIRPSDSWEIPAELVWEILIWLPVKSLMRFKSVCKAWLSIILDPSFAKAHLCGFQGLLFIDPYHSAPKHCFFYVNLDNHPSELRYHLTMDHGDKRMGRTNVVNGLVCFFYHSYSYLCNIATHEIMQLPSSTAELRARARKLGCEILSIGLDASWRPVDAPSKKRIDDDSVCYNGVLYWMESNMGKEKDYLVAFDLAREKFQIIPPPPEEEDRPFSVARFGPSLTLTSWVGDGWDWQGFIFRCCNDGIGRDSGWVWTNEREFEVSLMCGYKSYDPCFRGVLPNGKALITDLRSGKSTPSPFYLFDPPKGEYEIIPVHATTESASLFNNEADVLYYKENIISLRSLISNTYVMLGPLVAFHLTYSKIWIAPILGRSWRSTSPILGLINHKRLI